MHIIASTKGMLLDRAGKRVRSYAGMIWSWDLSATLGWADGSTPGSWTQRLQASGHSTMLGGSGSCVEPASGLEHSARPLGSVYEGHFWHYQNKLALCNPGLLVTWHPSWDISECDHNIHTRVSQLLCRSHKSLIGPHV